jgi:hypothetical protein
MRRAAAGLKRAALSLALLLPAACCAPAAIHCNPGEQPAVLETLYFGTARHGGGAVSEREWQDFVRAEVSPRLPQGYTLLEAEGQWRNAAGEVEREHSHVLQVAHTAATEGEALDQITQRYKSQFGQEAVLRLRSAACLSL